ncbi:hypothetical protein [Faecalicatena contorta]|uniref:hypothetical protein n=1 Tax=Faecalicatena contorta TaxID=39482 RepID=UPI00189AEF8E|nr:hypothetical protein [Faecalicatena contorta]
MKNREYKTLVAIALAMSMAAGTLAAPVACYAKENTARTEESAVKDTKTSKSGVRPVKDETVYAKIDGSGSVTAVTVSDQLKNVKDVSEIKDVSTLQNIENVKGDEAFTQKSNSITWNGDSKDICYQGTTTQALPVGVTITYTLDGKSISAGELQGKSGHLRIRYQYQNTSGKNGSEYTPFLMVTGLILDADKFTNIKVTNGKLVSDGDRDMALGMGLPRVKENLGVTDLDIPDYFELEADVTDYDAVEGITIATNDVFNSLETDKLEDLNDLKSSMNKLQDSANQLVDGSGELKSGLDTLLSSSGTLTDGIGQLVSGSSALKDGTETLASGSNELRDGSAALAEGASQLLDGTGALNTGAGELHAGLNLVSGKVTDELLPGVQALDAGVQEMQKSLGAQLPALCQGIAVLNDGIAQTAAGAAALDAGIQQVSDGAAALDSGTRQAAAGAANLNSGIQETAAGTGELSAAAWQLANALSAGPESQAAGDTTSSWDEVTQLQELETTLQGCEDLPEGTLEVLEGVIGSLQADQNERDTLANTAPASDNSALSLLAQKVAAGATAIDTAFHGDGTNPGIADGAAFLSAALNDGDPASGVPSIAYAASALNNALNTGDSSTGTASIRAGSAALNAALNTGDASAQTPSIKDGISSLNEGVNGENGLSTQVNQGVSQLKAGTSQVLGGIDGNAGLAAGLKQLSEGASQVNTGAGTLHEKMGEAGDGASSLMEGASRIASGAGDLNTGAGTLATGIRTLQAGSGALIDGVKQLDDGAKTLNDGMIQFNEEGIKKLVSAFDGDLDGLLDKLNTMIASSKKYTNFSGISDGMDGEVKFIFVSNK